MINFEPLSKLSLLKKMRGFCENFRFSANLDLQKAKRKRSESEANALQFSAKRSEAKRIRFAFAIFAIKRTSHCECTPLVYGPKRVSAVLIRVWKTLDTAKYIFLYLKGQVDFPRTLCFYKNLNALAMLTVLFHVDSERPS